MSTRSVRVGVLVSLLVGAATVVARQAGPAAPEGPDLGVPATTTNVARMDVSIPPDGTGLPPGSGTAAQGEKVYIEKCVQCHTVDGTGTPNDQLAGGQGTIGSSRPVRTVGSYWPYATTVFDYVRRAMPYPAPHSLTNDEAYAVTAYLLRLNGIVGEDTVIDAKTLPQVRMPNRNGFQDASGDQGR
jgi:mono/diheme cytochrome c family protein